MNSDYWIPLILCAASIAGYCTFKLYIDPFGWKSCCRRKATLIFDDRSEYELISPAPNVIIPYISGFAREYGRSIGNYSNLLKVEIERPKNLPNNCKIICVQRGKIYLLSMRDGVGDLLTIPEEDSYEGYLVLLKKIGTSDIAIPGKSAEEAYGHLSGYRN